MMAEDLSFCLFRRNALALAVAIKDVAEIVEIDALVRISFCPPRIAGLCPYHRQVDPVVLLGPARLNSQAAPEKRNPGAGSRDTVLIMQTEQGLWGIKIDREGTVITAERPARHEPKHEHSGVVAVGLVHHGELDHTLLDAEATWCDLRETVVGWYGRLRTGTSLSQFADAGSKQFLKPVESAGAVPRTTGNEGPFRGCP
jgi:purine-binding chemotaxis protein CheW